MNFLKFIWSQNLCKSMTSNVYDNTKILKASNMLASFCTTHHFSNTVYHCISSNFEMFVNKFLNSETMRLMCVVRYWNAIRDSVKTMRLIRKRWGFSKRSYNFLRQYSSILIEYFLILNPVIYPLVDIGSFLSCKGNLCSIGVYRSAMRVYCLTSFWSCVFLYDYMACYWPRSKTRPETK